MYGLIPECSVDNIASCDSLIHIPVECTRRSLMIWCGWKVVTRRMLSLSLLLCFHPETGLVIFIAGFDELILLLEIASL